MKQFKLFENNSRKIQFRTFWPRLKANNSTLSQRFSYFKASLERLMCLLSLSIENLNLSSIMIELWSFSLNMKKFVFYKKK
jgi:hypothetical protein